MTNIPMGWRKFLHCMHLVGLNGLPFSCEQVCSLLFCQILYCWLLSEFGENRIKISGKRAR